MKPFAIILDIMTPGMDGWEVMKHLKDNKQAHNIPVIIASLIEQSKLSVIWKSVEHFVKPVQKERLFAALERFKDKNSLDLTDMNSLNENVFCTMHKGMFNMDELINFIKTVQNRKLDRIIS